MILLLALTAIVGAIAGVTWLWVASLVILAVLYLIALYS